MFCILFVCVHCCIVFAFVFLNRFCICFLDFVCVYYYIVVFVCVDCCVCSLCVLLHFLCGCLCFAFCLCVPTVVLFLHLFY